MKYIVLLLLTLFLTACAAGNFSPAPTSTPNAPVTPTEPSTSIPPSPSAIPSVAPSETSVPLPVEIAPDQMTITFDLTNPNIPATNEDMVTTGVLRQSVMDYWKTSAGGSLLNADGSVNMAKLPPGIKLAQPGQWTINKKAQNDEFIFIKFGGQYGLVNSMGEYPIQKTNLLFQLTDGQGNNIGTVPTELLYYQDAQNIAHIEPVFFLIYSADTVKTAEINRVFGHNNDSSFTGIATPYLDLKTGQTNSSEIIINAQKLSEDDMQSQREKFAAQLIASQDPKGMGDLLWGGWSVGMIP
ncbi:MAG TPA: hypothetical protein VIN60_09425 [Anaerolineales bacterium]